jgi:hypothetical protein
LTGSFEALKQWIIILLNEIFTKFTTPAAEEEQSEQKVNYFPPVTLHRNTAPATPWVSHAPDPHQPQSTPLSPRNNMK